MGHAQLMFSFTMFTFNRTTDRQTNKHTNQPMLPTNQQINKVKTITPPLGGGYKNFVGLVILYANTRVCHAHRYILQFTL